MYIDWLNSTRLYDQKLHWSVANYSSYGMACVPIHTTKHSIRYLCVCVWVYGSCAVQLGGGENDVDSVWQQQLATVVSMSPSFRSFGGPVGSPRHRAEADILPTIHAYEYFSDTVLPGTSRRVTRHRTPTDHVLAAVFDSQWSPPNKQDRITN